MDNNLGSKNDGEALQLLLCKHPKSFYISVGDSNDLSTTGVDS